MVMAEVLQLAMDLVAKSHYSLFLYLDNKGIYKWV